MLYKLLLNCTESLKHDNIDKIFKRYQMYLITEYEHLNMIQNRDIDFTISTLNTIKEFVKSFKLDDIHKFCILLSEEHIWLI